MFLSILYHGDVRGTREAYGPSLGRESLSGSPSSVIISRRSKWASRVGWAGEDGGARHHCSPLGSEDEGDKVRILTRGNACADELRLMGVEREEVRAEVGSTNGG